MPDDDKSLIHRIDEATSVAGWSILVGSAHPLSPEDVAKCEWEAFAALRSEFPDLRSYVSYREAEEAGLIQRYRNATERLPADPEIARNRAAREAFERSDCLQSLQAGSAVVRAKRCGAGGDWSTVEAVTLPPEFWQRGVFAITREPATIVQFVDGGRPVRFADPVVRRAPAGAAASRRPTDDEVASLIDTTFPAEMPGITDAERTLRPLIRKAFGQPAKAEQLRQVLDREKFASRRSKPGRPPRQA